MNRILAKVIFKWTTADLVSEFSFETSHCTKAKQQNETQTATSRIWTRLVDSYEENWYTTNISIIIILVRQFVLVFRFEFRNLNSVHLAAIWLLHDDYY